MKYNNFHFEKAKSFVDEETASESQPIQKGTLLFTGTGETAEDVYKRRRRCDHTLSGKCKIVS